ncbi:Nn.00g010960.m01.CDS01 [Neocucurbitaria sp. VM-36]
MMASRPIPTGDPPGYANPNNFRRERRCRVCTGPHGPDTLPDVRFCELHCRQNNSEGARLGRLAVRLQDYFGILCEKHRAVRGWTRVEEYEDPTHSAAQRQWWRWVVLFHLMCENSHRDLTWILQDWRGGRLFQGYGLTVYQIHKVRFATRPGYDYLHCVFVIVLASGAVWVFDPTGVQFGPNWPLISPYYWYLREKWGHGGPYWQERIA